MRHAVGDLIARGGGQWFSTIRRRVNYVFFEFVSFSLRDIIIPRIVFHITTESLFMHIFTRYSKREWLVIDIVISRSIYTIYENRDRQFDDFFFI